MSQLITKYLSGKATREEVKEVEAWKAEHPEEFRNHEEKWLVQFKRKKLNAWLLLIAAAIFQTSMLAYLILDDRSKRVQDEPLADGWVEVRTDEGETKEVSLPDDSKVLLRGNSRLSYPSGFLSERLVSFAGRAYFQVAADSVRLFKLETIEATITTHEASFLLQTAITQSEVTVDSGSLAFSKKPDPGVAMRSVSLDLAMGEMGIVKRKGGGVIKTLNINPNYLAWRTRKITFNNTRISDVVLTLNEVYEADVRLGNEALGACRLTATYHNRPLSEVMKTLGEAMKWEVEGSGSRFKIKGDACKIP